MDLYEINALHLSKVIISFNLLVCRRVYEFLTVSEAFYANVINFIKHKII